MDRREFAALLPALLAGVSNGKVNAATLPTVQSGKFEPGPAKPSSVPKRASRAYTKGMLKAGNIQFEAHETTQQVGAPHEPEETHLHSEIWFVRKGSIDLTINDQVHRLNAGDMGICVAG